LFTVKQTPEKCWEYNLSVYNIYVDFKQAYDSIQRKKLYTIMYEFGLPPKLVRLVRATMTDTESQVKVQTDPTDTFEIRQGLKQGYGLAPMLFNLALEYVITKLPADANGTLKYKMNQVVGYADDICLLGRSARSVNEVYKELKINAEKIGLNINVNKTKAVLHTRMQSTETEQLRIDDHNIQVVDTFVYLGSCITKDNDEYIKIQRQLKLVNKAYFSL
jgi:sorting nexin-29